MTTEARRPTHQDPPHPSSAGSGDVSHLLSAIIRRAVREEVEEVLLDLAQPPRPALLDTAELARELSTSEATIRRQRKLGLPTVMLGDSPRFDLAEVLAWLRSRS